LLVWPAISPSGVTGHVPHPAIISEALTGFPKNRLSRGRVQIAEAKRLQCPEYAARSKRNPERRGTFAGIASYSLAPISSAQLSSGISAWPR
jgi:hypothetical protein